MTSQVLGSCRSTPCLELGSAARRAELRARHGPEVTMPAWLASSQRQIPKVLETFRVFSTGSMRALSPMASEGSTDSPALPEMPLPEAEPAPTVSQKEPFQERM